MSNQIVTTDSTSLQFSAYAIRKAFKEANPGCTAKEAKAHVDFTLRQGHAMTPAYINAKLAQGWTWQGVKPNAKDTRAQLTLVAPSAAAKETQLTLAQQEIANLKAQLASLLGNAAPAAPAIVEVPTYA